MGKTGGFFRGLWQFIWSGKEAIIFFLAFYLIIRIVSLCSGVYVCTSSSAYTYHIYEDCEALERCSGQTRKIMEFRAWVGGRDMCGYCKERMEEEADYRRDSYY